MYKSVQGKRFLQAGNGNLTSTDILNYEVVIHFTDQQILNNHTHE